MFAKRVVRLVLAPGALPYALLAAVLTMIWLGVGRPAPPARSVMAGATPTPASAPGRDDSNGALIGLDQAVVSVRRFAGEPSLVLEGGLQTDSTGARQIDFYYLEAVGQVRGEDFFKVDARTGEVIEATFRSRLAPSSPPIGLGPAEAEQAAARFAQERFVGFDELRLVERSSRVSESNVVHSFKWNQIAADSEAELPVSVSVAIASGSGEVVWYLAQREPLLVATRPTIDRARAIRTAARALGRSEARWDPSPSSVRLQVLYDDDDQQQLVWSMTFRSRQEGSRPTLRLLVNAHTGELIAGPS